MKNVCIGVLLCGIFFCSNVNTSRSLERPSKTTELRTDTPGLLERLFLFPLTFLQDEPTENDVVSTDTSLQMCDGDTMFDVFIDAVTTMVWRLWSLLGENCESLGLWDSHLIGTDKNPSDDSFGIISATFGQTTALLPRWNVVKEVTTSSLKMAMEIVDVSNARMRVSNVMTKTSEMTSHLWAIVTMTWATLLRWTVATFLAVSCFQYFLPKETLNGNTNRRNLIVARLREKLFKEKRRQQHASPMSSPRAKVHFKMCEVYDTLPCNCGGQKTSSSWKDSHYRMCEIFDRQRCNCGGRRKGPRELEKHHAKCEVLDGGCCNSNCGNVVVKNRPPVNIIVLGNPGKLIKLTRTRSEGLNELSTSFQDSQIGVSDVENDSQVNMLLPKTVAFIDDIEATDQLDTIYKGGDELLELDTSLCSDIGQPCFNSSFKEQSPLEDIETISQSSAYFSPASGDGVESKLSPRRSPQKRRGQEDSSLADDFYWSFHDAESFLENSNLDQSISYQRGDGIVEIAMVLLVKGAIKVTAWFLKKQGFTKTSDGETPQAENANTNSEIQRRRPRNRIRYHRQFSGSLNNSAIVLHDSTFGSDGACGDFAEITDADNEIDKGFSKDLVDKMNCLGAFDDNKLENNGSVPVNDANNVIQEPFESDKEPVIIESIYSLINDDAHARDTQNRLTSGTRWTTSSNEHSSDDGNYFELSNESEAVVTAIEDLPVCIVLNNITETDHDEELMIEGLESPTWEKDSSSEPEGLSSNPIEQTNVEDNLITCIVTDSVKQHGLIDDNLITIAQCDAPKVHLFENNTCMSVTENEQSQDRKDHSRTNYVAINETTSSLCNNSTPLLISDVAIQEGGIVLLPSEPMANANEDWDYIEDNKTPERSASEGYLTDSSG